MSTPQAKRRRLNEASTTLRKPFKSPFRTPLKPYTLSSDPLSSDTPDVLAPESTSVSGALDTSKSEFPTFHNHKPTLSSSLISARASPKKTSLSLAREIITVRSEIQILIQAHSLATSAKDEDLTRLIDTWRTASRAAAEELFANTRDRVNRMGGVSGWKQQERDQKEWRKRMDREAEKAERESREAELRARGEDADANQRYDMDQYDGDEERDKEDEQEDTVGSDEVSLKCC